MHIFSPRQSARKKRKDGIMAIRSELFTLCVCVCVHQFGMCVVRRLFLSIGRYVTMCAFYDGDARHF